MNATKQQKQLIHVNTQKSGLKEELVQWACNDNDKTSCNDLSFDQANAVLQELGLKPHRKEVDREAMRYARFDRANQQHKKILSTLMIIGWTQPHPRWGKTADMERFGKWLMSDKSPVRYPLRKMTVLETSKIISALESMTVKKYKTKPNV